MDAVAPPDDGDFIQVVARAIDVLRCFDGAHVALGNQDIAARTGLPKSTVSRLTYTLTRIGHLAYLADAQKYRPGDGALALSSATLRGLDHRAVIHSWLHELALRIPGTWGMTIRDRLDMVYLAHARAIGTLGLQSTAGSRVPLASTACGRAYLAAQPAPTRERLLSEIARQAPEDARKLRTWLASHLAAFRRTGYVVSCGDWNRHINGIALPLHSPTFGTTLVFVLGAMATDYSQERLRREVAPLLIALAERVRSLDLESQE